MKEDKNVYWAVKLDESIHINDYLGLTDYDSPPNYNQTNYFYSVEHKHFDDYSKQIMPGFELW